MASGATLLLLSAILGITHSFYGDSISFMPAQRMRDGTFKVQYYFIMVSLFFFLSVINRKVQHWRFARGVKWNQLDLIYCYFIFKWCCKISARVNCKLRNDTMAKIVQFYWFNELYSHKVSQMYSYSTFIQQASQNAS